MHPIFKRKYFVKFSSRLAVKFASFQFVFERQIHCITHLVLTSSRSVDVRVNDSMKWNINVSYSTDREK